MQKSERLFRMVLLLRRGSVFTAEDLARRLEVSERTIYRDVQSLVLSGIPVEGEAGIGYVLRHKLDLPPLMFTTEEAKAVALGLRMVQAWGDPALEQAAQQTLEKIWAVAPPKVREELDSQTLQVPGFHIDTAVRKTLGTVREGIDARRKVKFDYVRADGTPSTRSIWPLGLFFWGDRWSIAAWCELREGFRNFRTDRIREPRLLAATFRTGRGITLDDYMRSVSQA